MARRRENVFGAVAAVGVGLLVAGMQTAPVSASDLLVDSNVETPLTLFQEQASPEVDVTVNTGGSSIVMSYSGVSIGYDIPGSPVDDAVNIELAPVAEQRSMISGAIASVEQKGATLSTFRTENGVKTLIEIGSADSPTEYVFPLKLSDGFSATLQPSGSVAVHSDEGELVATVKEPWAIDAAGIDVPTSFRLEGNNLIQVVNFTANNRFPIVADPDVGREWWGFWIKTTKAETRQGASQADELAWVKTISQGICSAAGGGWTIALCIAAIEAGWSRTGPGIFRNAANQGKCVALNFPIPWGYFVNFTVTGCNR